MFRLCLFLVLIQACKFQPVSESVQPGDSVTLNCTIHTETCAGEHSVYWFRHGLGESPPEIIYTNYEKNAIFYRDFKGNPRVSVESGNGINHLKISDVQLSDSAEYYCGSSYSNMVEFAEGYILIVKGSGSRNTTVVQQPVSESVQPGDYVTLNCTIHTETCAGEHSVYWFRHGSGESHPGIIYTHGDRSDQCEKSPEAGSPTQSCVYNLPKRNLSLSDAGTYYCAVASCGEILFGNGTILDIKEPLLLVYCLSASLGLSFILITVLGFIMYNMNKRKCLQCRVIYCSSQAQDADSLHYVALNLSNKKNRSRRQRSNMEEETVYSGIRQ
uniref:Ig-like domain-containing protein n=1 Tax=Oncorhynchus tshawytscha TaxID=74940 RepID=A0A8C8FMQ3_ONCTS